MMSRRATNADRVEQRSWLRSALRFGLLDRVPPRYDQGDGRGPRTAVFAQSLLNELTDADRGERSPAHVLEKIRKFRGWVEEQQRLGRRIILGERSASTERASVLATEIVLALSRRVPDDHPPPPQRPDEHPMWDRWMDG